MTREMLINTVEGQECRIALVTQSKLDELYIERVSNASHVGNIYKGRITNVEPSIQAAFVDFGLTKNGFLHISDVNPSFFPKSRRSGKEETVGRKRAHRDRPPIQDCLRRGQEVIVQLTKEGIGTKGPTMTTYLSIPGRLLVMMPGMSRLGVSRKIENEDARDKARQILAELNPPSDIGFIVRTAAIERSKRDFQRDLSYLLRLWKNIKHRINTTKAPSEIYQESDLVTRTIRDVYNPTEIDRIICDNVDVARRVREFLDMALPRSKNAIELYSGREGLFHEYGLEAEIERIYARKMDLPSGGSLVFDQAEALVAIDVNSGRFREHSDAETTATKNNIEAAREIARQLRLRDLGGVIIIDFIDMRDEKDRRSVEKALRDEIRNDRAKTKVCRISPFGIVEMTRQRMRPSLKQGIFRTCPHCDGTGHIKNEESQALLVMRNLQRVCNNEQVAQIEIAVTPAVAHHLGNFERRQISDIEARCGKVIIVKADESLIGADTRITCTNGRGSVVAWEQPLRAAGGDRKVPTVPFDEPRAPVVYEEGEEELNDISEARELEMEMLEDEEVGSREGGLPHEYAEGEFEEAYRHEEVDFDEVQPSGRREPAGAERVAQAQRQAPKDEPVEPVAVGAPSPAAPATGPDGEELPRKKGRHRGRRGGRRHKRRKELLAQAQAEAEAQAQGQVPQAARAEDTGAADVTKPAAAAPAAAAIPSGAAVPPAAAGSQAAAAQPRREGRGRRRGRKPREQGQAHPQPQAPQQPQPAQRETAQHEVAQREAAPAVEAKPPGQTPPAVQAPPAVPPVPAAPSAPAVEPAKPAVEPPVAPAVPAATTKAAKSGAKSAAKPAAKPAAKRAPRKRRPAGEAAAAAATPTPRRKGTGHKQDKEYYEERTREAKQVNPRPEIVDESDADFSTE